MTNIIDTPTNKILKEFKRFYRAKLTGALNKSEFKGILIDIGDLAANKIKNGKMSQEDQNSIERWLVDSDVYFKVNHKDLDVAKKTFKEGDAFARDEINKKLLASEPVLDEDYYKGYRKVA